ncbi:hypothetical protein [uncultured Variovorax sp.]|uniref:hypothetical protein n=1 Tax=uncultured Variovorax sp. TaxID=114708 RepID=UPI0025F147C3|nr:hypothetical protein [uncultured Variovorax sp.]
MDHPVGLAVVCRSAIANCSAPEQTVMAIDSSSAARAQQRQPAAREAGGVA